MYPYYTLISKMLPKKLQNKTKRYLFIKINNYYN